jgi:type IX secretion system PorP/SprF family membrane protein
VRYWKIKLFLLFVLTPSGLYGQLSPLNSQYIFNGYMVNPALAGFDGTESINITARQQWVGYDGNPKTYWLSYQNRVLKRRFVLRGKLFDKGKKYVPKTTGRVGVGCNIFNDTYGILKRSGGQATYSYNIVLGRTGYHLSFGLSAFLYTLRIDPAKMKLIDNVDPYINGMVNDRTLVPDFAAGVVIRNNHYFAGLSAGQLTQSSIKVFNSGDYRHYKPGRTYSIIAGWHMYETSDIDIQPSMLVKTTEYRFLDSTSLKTGKFTLKAQVDLSLKTTIRDKFWIGFSYRSNNDIVLFTGFRYNRLFVGYAMDYPTSTLRYQNWGTHEISITYKTGTTDRRFRYRERY